MLFSKATSVAYVEQEIVEQLRGFFGGGEYGAEKSRKNILYQVTRDKRKRETVSYELE